MNDDTGPIPAFKSMRLYGDPVHGEFSYSENSDMFGDSSPRIYLEDPISATLPPPMVLGLNFTEPPRRGRHKRPHRLWRRHG